MEKAAFIIYLIVMVLSPLLFGAVHTYAYTIMSLGVLAGSLLLVKNNITKDPKSGVYQFQFPVTSLNFLFFILLIFLFIQVIPIPETILEFLSPEAGVVGEKSLPASGLLPSTGQVKSWFALSPHYYPVRMSIIRWTVYGLFFFGLSHVLNSRKRIELAIFLILITGCFETLYGLIQTYSGSNHIWWFKKTFHLRDVTGTYNNRNHFAGLMEMGILLAAAYAAGLSGRRRKRKTVSVSGRKSNLRVRLSRFLSGEQRFNKRSFILFTGAVMGIGLIFSASRGGMLGGAAGLFCLSLFFLFRKNHRRKGYILLSLFLIIWIYALQIGAEYSLGRFKYFYDSLQARTRYAQKTMDMFKDYKLTGIGVGNFHYAYPKYQATEDKKVFIRHAHNDWAQFLAEAGITGLFLLMAGISYYVYRTMKLWKKRKDPFAICLGVVPMAAMTAIGVHSYSDFNLHIPANFLMLTAIMAIGYSALHLKRVHHGGGENLTRNHILPLKYKGFLILLPLLGLIVLNVFWSVRHFVAEIYCNTVTQYVALNRDKNPPLEEIKKAIKWDGVNATYWYKLARELMRIRDSEWGVLNGEMKERREHQMEIIRALEQAVRLNPLKGEYHLRLGMEYAYLWREPDSSQRWIPAADSAMERAAYFTGENNPYLHVMMGNYWVRRSKTILPANPKWEVAWSKAVWHYKKNLSLESGHYRKKMVALIRKIVWRFYPDETFINQVIE